MLALAVVLGTLIACLTIVALAALRFAKKPGSEEIEELKRDQAFFSRQLCQLSEKAASDVRDIRTDLDRHSVRLDSLEADTGTSNQKTLALAERRMQRKLRAQARAAEAAWAAWGARKAEELEERRTERKLRAEARGRKIAEIRELTRGIWVSGGALWYTCTRCGHRGTRGPLGGCPVCGQ